MIKVGWMAIALAALFESEVQRANAATERPVAPVLMSTVSCEPAPGQGRIRCEAEARIEGAGAIEWADLQIVSVPPFLEPLKARMAIGDASQRSERSWHIGFAMIAKERGEGEATVRIRVVVCAGRACTPQESIARVHVRVG